MHKVCPKCGRATELDMNYCANCGHQFEYLSPERIKAETKKVNQIVIGALLALVIFMGTLAYIYR